MADGGALDPHSTIHNENGGEVTALLSIRSLRVHFTDREPPVKAVDGVDLDLQAGETLGLVGESGCGKTMLALSLGQLLPPGARIVSGSIRFDRQELTALQGEQLLEVRGGKIAYVFQDPMTALNPVLSIGEQITESVRLHQGKVGPPAQEAALELLQQVQIPIPERRIRQYPHQLSGGMRQRVLIAMALAGNPSLLIADEPTTALDVTTQAEILALLKAVQKKRRMAILLITHDLAAVAPVADRIAVMYAGRIVEVAEKSRFYRQPSHPYTQALLNCLPRVGQGRQTFQSIPGAVPDLSATPAGCPFHPRCPEAFDRCPKEEPQLQPVGEKHTVRCWKRMENGTVTPG